MEAITATTPSIDAVLVGGELRRLLGYAPIPHPNAEDIDIVAHRFQQAVEFEIPNIAPDLKHAYDVHESLRKTLKDTDILTGMEGIFNPLNAALVGAIYDLKVIVRRNPPGVSLSNNDGVKVDLTYSKPSPFNARTSRECVLSLDALTLPLTYTASGLVPSKIDWTSIEQELELKIKGDIALLDTERAISLTLSLISKSLIERDGERIPINFGDTQEEIKNTRELLILSLSLILMDKDKYQKYYDRLLYCVLNWDNLDSRIQEIIILAFQFVDYKKTIDSVSTS